MSRHVERAMEISSIILGDEPNNVGLFAGSSLPHLEVPDAPVGSRYHKNNGEIYTLISNDGSTSSNWTLEDGSGNTVVDLDVRFFNKDETQDNIQVSNFKIPFFNKDTSSDDIGVI